MNKTKELNKYIASLKLFEEEEYNLRCVLLREKPDNDIHYLLDLDRVRKADYDLSWLNGLGRFTDKPSYDYEYECYKINKENNERKKAEREAKKYNRLCSEWKGYLCRNCWEVMNKAFGKDEETYNEFNELNNKIVHMTNEEIHDYILAKGYSEDDFIRFNTSGK